MKNLKRFIAACLCATVSLIHAQTFGGNAAVAKPAAPAPAAAAVAAQPAAPAAAPGAELVEAQEFFPQASATADAQSQVNAVRIAHPSWQSGYDEAKDRIIVSQKIEFDVRNPKSSTDFINLRTEKMSELLMNAKAEIITAIFSKMSGERILDVPGNNLEKSLQEKHKSIQGDMEELVGALSEMDKAFGETTAARTEAALTDRVASLGEWFDARERENYSSRLDEAQKKTYTEAKTMFQRVKKEAAQLKQLADQARDRISKKLTTKYSLVAAMPIYGCTVLAQAESVKRVGLGKYQYQIAILYCWSGAMQRAAGAILKGQSVSFKPGKRDIDAWVGAMVKTGGIGTCIGPRSFIDNKGHMWFLGIAAAPTSEISDIGEANLNMAKLEARAEVMFSLYADASSSQTMSKVMETRLTGAAGESQTSIEREYTRTMKESFKDIGISGVKEVFTGTVRHQASNVDIQVVVYGVDSSSAKALKDIQTRAIQLGIEVNTEQEKERGRQKALKEAFDASRDNPAARRAGYEQGMREAKPAPKASAPAPSAPAKAPASGAPRSKGFQQAPETPAKTSDKVKLAPGSIIFVESED